MYWWIDLIGEVEKDPWGFALKIVTKRLENRRKNPGVDNTDRVKYIVRSLFLHMQVFQRQDRSSCVVRRKKRLHRGDGAEKGSRLPVENDR